MMALPSSHFFVLAAKRESLFGNPFSCLRVAGGKGSGETFEKCSILLKFKKGENFNHRNTLSISRIRI